MAERPAALVTGGGQGIGRAIAAALLEGGWRVAIFDHDRDAAEQAAALLGGNGEVLALTGDVSVEAEVAAAVAATAERFGRLDGLVSNAGTMVRKPVTELSLDEWNRVIGINLTGAFLCAKHAAPHLKAARGAMVTIASSRALMSEADTESYSASKGGLVALTHALAISLGPEVRVNCVSPGWIDVSRTGKSGARQPEPLRPEDHAQHPVGRVGVPHDVAALVRFLLGPEAGFITGSHVVADGGMTRKMIYV